MHIIILARTRLYRGFYLKVIKGAILGQLAHPLPELGGREPDAVVKAALYPVDEQATQTLDREAASAVLALAVIDVRLDSLLLILSVQSKYTITHVVLEKVHNRRAVHALQLVARRLNRGVHWMSAMLVHREANQ